MQYSCQPMSRKNLRDYAYNIRKQLGFENSARLPILTLFERLHALIGDDSFEFTCEPDDNFELGVHAKYRPEENSIGIKESVYLGAYQGNGRDRMTIAHELAHLLLLKVSGVQLTRSFTDGKIKTYCDPEWQAKCLAGELMIPYHLMKNMTVREIAEQCGVSYDAAAFQKSKFK